VRKNLRPSRHVRSLSPPSDDVKVSRQEGADDKQQSRERSRLLASNKARRLLGVESGDSGDNSASGRSSEPVNNNNSESDGPLLRTSSEGAGGARLPEHLPTDSKALRLLGIGPDGDDIGKRGKVKRRKTRLMALRGASPSTSLFGLSPSSSSASSLSSSASTVVAERQRFVPEFVKHNSWEDIEARLSDADRDFVHMLTANGGDAEARSATMGAAAQPQPPLSSAIAIAALPERAPSKPSRRLSMIASLHTARKRGDSGGASSPASSPRRHAASKQARSPSPRRRPNLMSPMFKAVQAALNERFPGKAASFPRPTRGAYKETFETWRDFAERHYGGATAPSDKATLSPRSMLVSLASASMDNVFGGAGSPAAPSSSSDADVDAAGSPCRSATVRAGFEKILVGVRALSGVGRTRRGSMSLKGPAGMRRDEYSYEPLPLVFHHRMVECERLLSAEQHARFMASLRDYLTVTASQQHQSAASDGNDGNDLRQLAFDLQIFLSQHIDDPDNAVIGLPVNMDVHGALVRRYFASDAEARSSCRRVHTSAAGLAFDELRDFALTRVVDEQRFREFIVRAAELNEGDAVLALVQSLASKFVGERCASLSVGDLVIVDASQCYSRRHRQLLSSSSDDDDVGEEEEEEENDDVDANVADDDLQEEEEEEEEEEEYIFCRFAGWSGGRNIGGYVDVFTSAEEDSIDIVAKRYVMPLPGSMQLMLRDPTRLTSLVDDALVALRRELVAALEVRVCALVSAEVAPHVDGVADDALLDEAFFGVDDDESVQLTFQAMHTLRAALSSPALVAPGSAVHAFTSDALLDWALRSIDAFAARGGGIVELLRRSSIESVVAYLGLTPAKVASRMAKAATRYCDVWTSRLDELVAGNTKARLTSWWLARIRSGVNSFLQRIGFSFVAVPDNYIAEPPRSVPLLRQNIALIHEVLDLDADKHSVRALIRNISADILPRIQDYMTLCRDVVCRMLGIERAHFSWALIRAWLDSRGADKEDVDDEEAEAEDEKNRDERIAAVPLPVELLVGSIAATAPSAATVKHLRGIVEDLNYLERLCALDLEFASREPGQSAAQPASSQSTDFHIVPISGLILSCFHRVRNELETASEVWDHRRQHAANRQRGDHDDDDEEGARATSL
jgi:hypothetical protein